MEHLLDDEPLAGRARKPREVLADFLVHVQVTAVLGQPVGKGRDGLRHRERIGHRRPIVSLGIALVAQGVAVDDEETRRPAGIQRLQLLCTEHLLRLQRLRPRLGMR